MELAWCWLFETIYRLFLDQLTLHKVGVNWMQTKLNDWAIIREPYYTYITIPYLLMYPFLSHHWFVHALYDISYVRVYVNMHAHMFVCRYLCVFVYRWAFNKTFRYKIYFLYHLTPRSEIINMKWINDEGSDHFYDFDWNSLFSGDSISDDDRSLPHNCRCDNDY